MDQPHTRNYRHGVRASVAAILTESGFDSADRAALESVAEIVCGFIRELGRSSRAFCELACRTQVIGADVMLALAEMGRPPVGLREYAWRSNRKTVGAPAVGAPARQPSILQTGERKKAGRSMLPEGCPEFPDSHSYIRTPTHKQPQADYESVREKAAAQKRDVERALTRFVAKTCGKTHSVFANEDADNVFPIISCADSTLHAELANTNLAEEAGLDSLQVPPYINALMFRDQIFEEDDREYSPKKRAKVSQTSGDADESVNEATAEPTPPVNPFIRPVRMPKNAMLPLPSRPE